MAQATVAGAGALGLGCALALADAGFAVTVCDPGPPLGGASAVAGGMLAPVFEAVLDPHAAPHFDLLMAARDLWPALEARSGVVLDRTGAMAAGRADWLQTLRGAILRLGLHATELPRRAAEGLAPGLAPELEGALLTREDWRLDARAALQALRAAAAAAGVSFRNQAAGGRGEADLLVVATGAGLGLAQAVPELAVLSPIKGHIVHARAPGVGGVTVRGEGVYVTPADGGMAIGATMEAGVADPAPDPASAGPLVRKGAALFPALAGAPFELQAGVRAATPDGLPLVGFGGEPGVILAVGARRNGWLIAPLVARVVAALAAGRDPGRYADSLDPRRFSRPR
jgi:glycine oxidase